MTLTKCPRCQCRCFSDGVECRRCGLTFPPGILNKQVEAKEKIFFLKSYLLFASLILIVTGVLLIVAISDYRNGTGLFSSLDAAKLTSQLDLEGREVGCL